LGFNAKQTKNKKNYEKEPLQAHTNWHYGTIGMAKKGSGG
jgi:hypothetical protein